MEEIKSKNETISYRPKTTYYFRPDMSVGSESDELNFINYPYLVRRFCKFHIKCMECM